jgi:hypothetical protein
MSPPKFCAIIAVSATQIHLHFNDVHYRSQNALNSCLS